MIGYGIVEVLDSKSPKESKGEINEAFDQEDNEEKSKTDDHQSATNL